jgi:hypothetical protein
MSTPRDNQTGTPSTSSGTSASTSNPGPANSSTTHRAEPGHPATHAVSRQWPEQVTQDEMADLVAAGRAEPWTQPLNTATGSHIPVVARLDGRWYAVLQGEEVYRPAHPALARELTDVTDRWNQANTALAAQRVTSPSGSADLGAANHPTPSDDRT